MTWLWQLLGLVAAVVLRLLDRAEKPVPPRDPRAVLADGLERKDAAKVAEAQQMRHETTQGLLARWRLEKARRRRE